VKRASRLTTTKTTHDPRLKPLSFNRDSSIGRPVMIQPVLTADNKLATEGPLLLVADDNEDNRYTLRQRLIREGYDNVIEAVDGREALELLRSHDIDLVLLDVLMPELDGYQVLEQMRNDKQLRNIPVIMNSAIDEIDSVVRCIEAGADDYLAKPYNPMLLRARILASLEKKKLRDESLQQLAIIRRVFGRYVPETIADAIVSGQGKLEPMHADATIMYTDIEDFTRISESMEPERVADMLNEYFEATIEPITRHGGVVNQFQGDAMLVTFNLPIPDAFHADKAILAAIEIQQVLSFRKFAGVNLTTRIGINSGRIFAGNVGSGDRVNFTVHGDAVNMAARLERLNKEYDSRVLVSEQTVQRLSNNYPLEAIGEVAIRGKSSQTKIYRLAA
jgi:adenylate cyclase